LNNAIVDSAPDAVSRCAAEISEILDAVWHDKTIAQRIKGLRIGIPLSIAAIGNVAAGLIGGATAGFLATLGFELLSKYVNIEEGLFEKVAKLRTTNCQANVYDFRETYKHQIPRRTQKRAQQEA
jgi:hypothetical protein